MTIEEEPNPKRRSRGSGTRHGILCRDDYTKASRRSASETEDFDTTEAPTDDDPDGQEVHEKANEKLEK